MKRKPDYAVKNTRKYLESCGYKKIGTSACIDNADSFKTMKNTYGDYYKNMGGYMNIKFIRAKSDTKNCRKYLVYGLFKKNYYKKFISKYDNYELLSLYSQLERNIVLRQKHIYGEYLFDMSSIIEKELLKRLNKKD